MARYKTSQRELILIYLKENSERHVTADDVIFYLKENGSSVGKATVYRYFDALLSEGLLRKFHGTNGKSACYQLIDKSENCHNHYHFICDQCNILFHIDCEILDSVQKHIKENHSFFIDNLKTTFHGVCDKCRIGG